MGQVFHFAYLITDTIQKHFLKARNYMLSEAGKKLNPFHYGRILLTVMVDY